MNGLLHALTRNKNPRLLLSAIFGALLTLSPVAAQPTSGMSPLLSEASQLMKLGKPGAAYTLLAAAEDQWAGSPKFDYLLGLVAIDTGHFDVAVLALQRVVLTDPASAAGRMELGRAYFGLGDMALARQEFEQLNALGPPLRAKVIIANYLERIRAAEGTYRSTSLGYIELEGGYNNNANGATSVGTFLQFQLDENSRRSSSGIYGLAVGGSVGMPLAPRWSLQSAARVSFRDHPNSASVDSLQFAAASHLQWKKGRQGARIGAIGQVVRLDREANSRIYALDTAAWKPISDAWLIRASARFGIAKYNFPVNVRDVRQQFYGLSALRQSPGKRQMQFELSVIGGNEEGLTDNAANERPFGRNLYGAQIAGSLFVSSNLRLFVSTGWLNSFYDGPFLRDSGLSGGRTDDQYVSSLSLVLLELPRLADWSLRNEYRYVSNDSDISLYEYDSFQVLLTARREFK